MLLLLFHGATTRAVIVAINPQVGRSCFSTVSSAPLGTDRNHSLLGSRTRGVCSSGEFDVAVPGGLRRVWQERSAGPHVYLVAPVVVPEDLCRFVEQTLLSHGPIQQPPVL